MGRNDEVVINIIWFYTHLFPTLNVKKWTKTVMINHQYLQIKPCIYESKMPTWCFGVYIERPALILLHWKHTATTARILYYQFLKYFFLCHITLEHSLMNYQSCISYKWIIQVITVYYVYIVSYFFYPYHWIFLF